MTKAVINQVRDYMTIVTEDRVYQICPVEMLLRRHSGESVVAFLVQLRADYKKELRELIRVNPDASEDQPSGGAEFPAEDGHQHHTKSRAGGGETWTGK